VKKYSLLWCFLLCWVCGWIGVRYGAARATDVFLITDSIGKTVDIRTYVTLGELIKTKKTEKAEELIENLIDADVSYLGVQANSKHLAEIKGDMIASIHRAKSYRQKFPSPDHKIRDSFKSGVDAAFKM
jgi:hypothetical protein